MMDQQCSLRPNKTLGHCLANYFANYLTNGSFRCDWFNGDEFWVSDNEYTNSISIPTGTAFNVFLNVKFSEGKLPINGCKNLFNKYRDYASKNISMSFPFGIANYIPVKSRRAETIFSRFFEGNPELIKYKTTKGQIYYAGNGIILNSKFEPILIPYYSMGVLDKINGVVFVVSPSVFTNQSGLVEKFIVKHFLPWIETAKSIYIPGFSNGLVPLLIEINSSFNDCITIPKITRENPTTDINKFLKENVNALIQQLWNQ